MITEALINYIIKSLPFQPINCHSAKWRIRPVDEHKFRRKITHFVINCNGRQRLCVDICTSKCADVFSRAFFVLLFHIPFISHWASNWAFHRLYTNGIWKCHFKWWKIICIKMAYQKHLRIDKNKSSLVPLSMCCIRVMEASEFDWVSSSRWSKFFIITHVRICIPLAKNRHYFVRISPELLYIGHQLMWTIRGKAVFIFMSHW